MQGCGGRRRIAVLGVLLLLLEYGVQCLPQTLQVARNGPSRCTGKAQSLVRQAGRKAAILGRPAVVGRITAWMFLTRTPGARNVTKYVLIRRLQVGEPR